MVDNDEKSNSLDIALEYYNEFPDNILILHNNDKNKFISYNLALDYVEGQYVNFMRVEDKLSLNALKKIDDILNKNDIEIVSLPVKIARKKNKLKFKYKFNFERYGFINLMKFNQYIQVNLGNVFINKDLIDNLRFDFECPMADALFLSNIFFIDPKYIIAKGAKYYASNSFGEVTFQNQKETIFSSFKYFFSKLISYSLNTFDYVPYFIQNVFLYYFSYLLFINDIDDVFDNQDDVDKFWNEFDEILEYLDVGNILSNKVLIRRFKTFLIYHKNKDFHSERTGNDIVFKSGNYKINHFNNHKFIFDIVDLKEGFLNISGTISSVCDNKFISVEAIKSTDDCKTVYEAKKASYPKTKRKTLNILSIPWYFYNDCDFKIPIDNDESCKISFNIVYWENDCRVVFNPNFEGRFYTHLSRYVNYFVKDNHIVLFKDNNLYINKFSYPMMVYREMHVIKEIISSKFKSKIRIKALFYRILYILMYPIMKNKKIWLFSDRKDLSGDNGEHFFNYAMNMEDNIKKYFIINKNSKDYARLKNMYGNHIVAFGSFKHKVLYMFTEKFMQSQVSPIMNNPFNKMKMRLYSGLCTAGNYFLQHGVARYDMSSWLTKFDKNLYLVLAVSDYDYNEFLGDNYNLDKDIIQTLGFPRFDNLTNDNLKKQIVIMPTWRNYITNKNQFINSELFERFNNLLNHPKLIQYAKDHGYEIVLKPHPNLNRFISAFELNDYIKVDNETKHHDLICDSALMITDYSSVAFDFAYLKKPIIYYQYDAGKDHHFDVDTVLAEDGSLEFGAIISDENILIDKIMEYIDNDCKMEEVYKRRVDNFFKYVDKNNSKRVYEWVCKD